jgi:prepilin-type N-terminal cleavage/methylation domain-containing protein
MRNKIKQLLKKEGGFTLVELLGVIVILGIIIAISVPMIGNVIAKAQTDADTNEKALVLDAAEMYFLQSEGSEVTTATLVDEGYLEADYDGAAITFEEDDKGIVTVK